MMNILLILFEIKTKSSNVLVVASLFTLLLAIDPIVSCYIHQIIERYTGNSNAMIAIAHNYLREWLKYIHMLSQNVK